MEGGGRKDTSNPVSKFAVYQNPALTAALTQNSLRPSKSTFLFILTLTSASAFTLVSFVLRENEIVDSSKLRYVTHDVAHIFLKVMQAVMTLILAGSVFALIKAISLCQTKAPTPSSTSNLTNEQLKLLGIKPKFEQTESKSSTEPPKSKPNTSPFSTLFPLHQTHTNSDRSTTITSANKIHFTTPTKPPVSPSVYLIPSQSPNMKTPPGTEPQHSSTPWSGKRSSSTREISTEQQLETFLADFDEKFSMSAGKMTTPPPTVSSFGSPNSNSTTRSTPLRPVRMSPGSQKFSTPPKKGEGELPPPMSIQESIDGFARIGIYPQIEEWRDHLRQWFSSVLLKPLLAKIETSHVKVMEAANKLGVSITVSKIGSDKLSTGVTASVSSEGIGEWQPAYTLDEEGLIGQLRISLLQQIQNSTVPVVQECIDAISEHQKLLALMKGEWAKGLLPQTSVRADYTLQRIRELAAGTCVKNYEYITKEEKSKNKKWSEVPTDSHLLLYLFCAFLEHPKWMLHVDPTSHVGSQSSRNPLFLGVLPSKERFPEKYVGVICGVPSVLHPGACVLAFDKKSSPVFALYWDKKPQFSFEGRTALWDSVLVLCHKIKSDYGGVVRGMHLGSSALGILSILDEENSE